MRSASSNSICEQQRVGGVERALGLRRLGQEPATCQRPAGGLGRLAGRPRAQRHVERHAGENDPLSRRRALELGRPEPAQPPHEDGAQRQAVAGRLEQLCLEPQREVAIAPVQLSDGPVEDRARPFQLPGVDQRAAEVERHVRPLDRIARVVERRGQVLRCVQTAGGGLGQPQAPEQPAPLVVRRRLVERAAEVSGRHVGRAHVQRGGGGTAQRRHAPCIGGRLGGEQVRGLVFEAHPVTLEKPRGAPVHQRALRSRYVFVHGGTDERMHELERSAERQDVGSGERIGRRGCRRVLDVRERGRPRDGRERLEHGRGAHERPGVLRQPAQPQQHDARDGLGAHLLDPDGRGRGRRDAVGGELADELVEEERVAARRRVTGAAEGLVGIDR